MCIIRWIKLGKQNSVGDNHFCFPNASRLLTVSSWNRKRSIRCLGSQTCTGTCLRYNDSPDIANPITSDTKLYGWPMVTESSTWKFVWKNFDSFPKQFICWSTDYTYQSTRTVPRQSNLFALYDSHHDSTHQSGARSKCFLVFHSLLAAHAYGPRSHQLFIELVCELKNNLCACLKALKWRAISRRERSSGMNQIGTE